MIKRYFSNNRLYAFVGIMFVMILCSRPFFTQAASVFALSEDVRVDTTSTAIASRIAPGDFLPIAVKLLNFGSSQRVDVTVTYAIINSQHKTVVIEHATVAVETTASFVKMIQIPLQSPPGIYVANATVSYQDQVGPATTEFSFTVEDTYFGLFERDFIKYGSFTILVGVLMGVLGHALVKRVRVSRLRQLDYANISQNERIFYELISDTILGMRERVGDVALDVAENIDGLRIDKKTGKVLALTDRPSKIIAALVFGYENVLGKKVSFSFRRNH